MNSEVDRLLHDIQRKVNGALFALSIRPLNTHPAESLKAARNLLREVDAMIDGFTDGAAPQTQSTEEESDA